jgi:hypothetical protein
MRDGTLLVVLAVPEILRGGVLGQPVALPPEMAASL